MDPKYIYSVTIATVDYNYPVKYKNEMKISGILL